MNYKDKKVWELIKSQIREIRHIERYSYFKNWGTPRYFTSGKKDFILSKDIFGLRYDNSLGIGKQELKDIISRLENSGRLIAIDGGYIRPSVSLILRISKENGKSK